MMGHEGQLVGGFTQFSLLDRLRNNTPMGWVPPFHSGNVAWM